MGSDSLTKFHKWDKWREISKLSKIVVFPRSGYFKRSLKCKAMKVLGSEKILFMKSKKIDIFRYSHLFEGHFCRSNL